MIEDTRTVVKEASAEDKDSDTSWHMESDGGSASDANEISESSANPESTQQADALADSERAAARTAQLSAVAEPPGRCLRRAREAKGLDQIEIARDLKLDVGLIDALERGDLHRIPPVYTAGYIRAYAKRVDLSAEQTQELVTEYIAQEAPHAPKLKKTQQTVPDRYRQVAESLPKSFSLAAANAREQLTKHYAPVAAAAVVLVFLVWQVFSIWSSDDAGSEIVAKQAGDQSENMPMPSEDEQNATLTAKAVDDVGSVAANNTAAATTGKQEKASSQAATQSNKGASDTSAAADKSTSAKPAEKAEQDALALLEKKNQTDLVLTFNRNSWVDIRDATGKHIIRQLGIAGNTQKVSGQAPFQVLLGYGHGVTIEYNGNEVDFSAFQGDRVARFTLEMPKKKVLND